MVVACVAATTLPLLGQRNRVNRSSEKIHSEQTQIINSTETKTVTALPKSESGTPPRDLLSSLSARLPPEILTLAEIVRRMRSSVEQIPNYTCLQTIRRKRITVDPIRGQKRKPGSAGSRGHTSTRSLESTDSFKIDVAFVAGKELYSWPGAKSFEDKPLPEIVGFGTVSTGDFATHARTLFVNRTARFDYASAVNLKGHQAVRYDFLVPLFRSGYVISDTKGQARVAYGGSIWADADTKNLLRIVTKVENIPPPLTISSVTNTLDYESVRFGSVDFQLPKQSHLVTHFRSGSENHNWVEFSGCREFGVQSKLSFADTLEEPMSSGSLVTKEFVLPPDISVHIQFKTTIDSVTSSAGDELQATVVRTVKHRGKTLIPKDAVVIGRLRRLESFSYPVDHFVVAFGFQRVEFGNRWAKLDAVLTDIASFPGLDGEYGQSNRLPASSRRVGMSTTGASTVLKTQEQAPLYYRSLALPGTVELYVRGKQFQIPEGHRAVWKTTQK